MITTEFITVNADRLANVTADVIDSNPGIMKALRNKDGAVYKEMIVKWANNLCDDDVRAIAAVFTLGELMKIVSLMNIMDQKDRE